MKNKQFEIQETILDSITEGVFTVDKDWCITSFNRAAENIIGISKKEAIAKKCHDVFHADVCGNNCVLRKTIKTGVPCIGQTVYVVNKSGKKIPIIISTAILKNKNGAIVGGVETFRDISVIEELRKEILGKHTYSDIITKDDKMLKIFDILPGMSTSDSTILITGDRGTGKELLARAIHSLNNRNDGPFISVNCGALPDTLLESELFGYKKGAFTDAKQDKPGRFQLAQGGTLFLDEIGDISNAMQVKLLRVMEEKRFEPLGAIKSEIANVRIITATNQNLPELIQEKKFRKDLYYRINTLVVKLPPLEKRKGDIPLLVEHFIAHFNGVYQKNVTGIDNNALAKLIRYSFPGNIRELKNIIEHAFIMCPLGNIESIHLPEDLTEKTREKIDEIPYPQKFEEYDKQDILRALEQNRFVKTKTAKQLGIHVTTLWRKMNKYNIE